MGDLHTIHRQQENSRRNPDFLVLDVDVLSLPPIKTTTNTYNEEMDPFTDSRLHVSTELHPPFCCQLFFTPLAQLPGFFFFAQVTEKSLQKRRSKNRMEDAVRWSQRSVLFSFSISSSFCNSASQFTTSGCFPELSLSTGTAVEKSSISLASASGQDGPKTGTGTANSNSTPNTTPQSWHKRRLGPSSTTWLNPRKVMLFFATV